MNNLIPGIQKIKGNNYIIYYIDSLSDEFRKSIRELLSSICHGINAIQNPENKLYSYQKTVEEFLRRYNASQEKNQNAKSPKHKKGMIGELLVHIILRLENHFELLSPFFNMEERSFRKGFDVLLFDPQLKELWITEVKSGEPLSLTVQQRISKLLSTAKADLRKRLNEENQSLWLNAQNAVRNSIASVVTQKDVKQILTRYSNLSADNQSSSQNHNVILASVLFSPLSELVEENTIIKSQSKIQQEHLFNKCIILVVQQHTFDEIYQFLSSEVSDGKKSDT